LNKKNPHLNQLSLNNHLSNQGQKIQTPNLKNLTNKYKNSTSDEIMSPDRQFKVTNLMHKLNNSTTNKDESNTD
jgi:hypothetical protein